MKKTTEESLVAYRILSNAKLTMMDGEEKFAIIRILHQIKPIVERYEDFLKDATYKLMPDGFQSVNEKLHKREALTEEEQKLLTKFNSEVSACVQDELKKEHEYDFTSLTSIALQHLLESNDFSANEGLLIYDFFG